MNLGIHSNAVDGVLHLEGLELSVALRIVLMKNRNGSTVASCVDALKTGIKLDHIRPILSGFTLRVIKHNFGGRFGVVHNHSRN
jgi:hypothetical protein